MAFIVIGVLGSSGWASAFIYDKPERAEGERGGTGVHKPGRQADATLMGKRSVKPAEKGYLLQAIRYRQTWSFAIGKFLTDGFGGSCSLGTRLPELVYGLDSTQRPHVFLVYLISMISILQGLLRLLHEQKKMIPPGMRPCFSPCSGIILFHSHWAEYPYGYP